MSQFEKTTALSEDPVKAIKEVIVVIHTLNEVYEHETHSLETLNTPEFLGLQDTKLNIAQSYAACIRDLKSRGQDAFKKVPHKLKLRLKEMQNKFSILAKRNVMALERMRILSNRLGETIHSAAKESAKNQQTFRYGENGSLYKKHKHALSMGISEQV